MSTSKQNALNNKKSTKIAPHKQFDSKGNETIHDQFGRVRAVRKNGDKKYNKVRTSEELENN